MLKGPRENTESAERFVDRMEAPITVNVTILHQEDKDAHGDPVKMLKFYEFHTTQGQGWTHLNVY